MTSDSTNPGRGTQESEIEKLAQEIGRLIRSADPERQEDFKELALTLIREEVIQRGGGEQGAEGSLPGPFNPLGTGFLILLMGGGLSFIFGPVGLFLMACGFFLVVWGGVMSLLRR